MDKSELLAKVFGKLEAIENALFVMREDMVRNLDDVEYEINEISGLIDEAFPRVT